MIPGGRFYQDVTESRGDYGVKSANMEGRSCLRLCSSAGGRHGMASNSVVHELLECPVCLTIMHPPIHQVCSLLPVVFVYRGLWICIWNWLSDYLRMKSYWSTYLHILTKFETFTHI